MIKTTIFFFNVQSHVAKVNAFALDFMYDSVERSISENLFNWKGFITKIKTVTDLKQGHIFNSKEQRPWVILVQKRLPVDKLR